MGNLSMAEIPGPSLEFGQKKLEMNKRLENVFLGIGRLSTHIKHLQKKLSPEGIHWNLNCNPKKHLVNGFLKAARLSTHVPTPQLQIRLWDLPTSPLHAKPGN